MFYFAYGMNTNPAHMGNSIFAGVGTIDNYRLECPKHFNIIEDDNHATKGVVWDIDYDQLVELDLREGYPYYYTREFIECRMNDGTILECLVYIMTPENRKLNIEHKPSDSYLNMVRNGYNNFNLPLPKILL